MLISDSVECEHEVDPDTPVEGGDLYDMMRFKAACVHIVCVKCGRRGMSVDDTGEFWEDNEGYLEA